MSDMNLEEELRRLEQLFWDATGEYEKQLMAAGNEGLADEWRYNVGDLLGDVRNIGEELAKVYAALPEDIPRAMSRFTESAIYGPEIHSRGHITRLKDVLEGRPPSWPEDPGPLEGPPNWPPEVPGGIESLDLELWGVMWQFRRATDGYVYLLRAAGQEKLADEWKHAIWKLTWEVMASGDALRKVYTSSPDQLPDKMRAFFQRALHAASEECRVQLTRLKDAVE